MANWYGADVDWSPIREQSFACARENSFATLQEASAPWGALLADNPIAPPIGNIP